jgi:hypothetical protein
MILFSMFREDGAEGKPGPMSMRRVLAFVLIAAAIGLFFGGFIFGTGMPVPEDSGVSARPWASSWHIFIPGIACLAGSLLLLFFTTWSDVAEIAKALKNK